MTLFGHGLDHAASRIVTSLAAVIALLVATGLPATERRIRYVAGGTSGPVVPAAQRIIPGKLDASG